MKIVKIMEIMMIVKEDEDYGENEDLKIMEMIKIIMTMMVEKMTMKLIVKGNDD